MDDIKGFTQDLRRLAEAVVAMQKRLESLDDSRTPVSPRPAEKPMLGTFLMRRQQVLAKLGIGRKVGRASWSHDNGDSIVFDAWDDIWETDHDGNPYYRYPVRTKTHYVLTQSKSHPSRGHTRWQHHVDMVIAGKRSAIAIMPVRTNSDRPNSRTKGWLPQYAKGEIRRDGDEYWFYSEAVCPI